MLDPHLSTPHPPTSTLTLTLPPPSLTFTLTHDPSPLQVILSLNFMPLAWTYAGRVLDYFGMGPEYEVGLFVHLLSSVDVVWIRMDFLLDTDGILWLWIWVWLSRSLPVELSPSGVCVATPFVASWSLHACTAGPAHTCSWHPSVSQ